MRGQIYFVNLFTKTSEAHIRAGAVSSLGKLPSSPDQIMKLM